MKSAIFSCLLATMLVVVGVSTTYKAKANEVAPYHNADSMRAMLIRDWERAKAYTKEYLDAMPEEGINFKPTPRHPQLCRTNAAPGPGNYWLVG